ncbi:MAG: aminopeptidase N, partial [Candidatus Paceibacteria bacterium]
ETFDMRMDRREHTFHALLSARPVSVSLDPEFDVFRLLDPLETPPSIGQIYGEPAILALLPSAAPNEEIEAYRRLLDSWQSPDHAIDIRLDREVTDLPADRALWVLGQDNLHRTHFDGWRQRAKAIDVGGSPLLEGDASLLANHSTVVIGRHPANTEKAMGWIVLDPPRALEGLARKLPHYGKYSYLAFEGDEPSNVLKGQWRAENSPLVGVFEGGSPTALELPTRRALAELPAVFSEAKLLEHVAWLAAPEREGRVPGSAGLDASADYIAAALAAAGLEPAGDNGSWFQEFTLQEGPGGQAVQVRNVIGLLRGHNEGWKDQCVVLSAHYDHLGLGWPDTRREDMGTLHPGANDNASGVSVMLELAKNLASQGAPSRNLLVIAFTAEECGLVGSRYYVEHPVLPLAGTRGVINLDTVGLLEDRPLAIHGTGTADEWQHIFRGCGFVTGIPSKNVAAGAEGSDQWSFIEKGVPAVQVLTGAGLDYHRPSDSIENVDVLGLLKVATFLKEALIYMVEREEPMKVTIEGVVSASAPRTGGRRGVSFGSIPEYGFEGVGMRLDGVSPNSPAEKAGLLPGDILIRIDEAVIGNTRAFAEILKTLVPDQVIRATVLRDGKERTFEVTLVER